VSQAATPPAATPPANPTMPELPPAGAPADGGAVDGQTQPEEQNAPPPQPQSRADRRYGELTAQRNQAREEAAYYRGQLEALQRARASAVWEPSAAAPPPPPPAPPDPNDTAKYPAGEFDTKYLRDLARYEARQEYEDRTREDRERQQTEAAEAAEFERYRAVFEDAQSRGLEGAVRVLSIPDADLQRSLARAESGPVLAEYFARRPDALTAVQRIPPGLDRAMAIARIDAMIVQGQRQLQAQRASPPAPVPPPPPPTPTPVPPLVNGRPGTSAPSGPPVGDYEAYRTWRMQNK